MHPVAQNDHRHPAGFRRALILIAMTTGLVALLGKGCTTSNPSNLRLRPPADGQALTSLTDRNGRLVAMVDAATNQGFSLAPAYTTICLERLDRQLGAGALGQFGPELELALDLPLQERARQALAHGLVTAELQHLKRQGKPAPRLMGAVVAIQVPDRRVLVLASAGPENRTGRVLANLPHRPGGTALKPILAAAALRAGMSENAPTIEIAQPEAPSRTTKDWTPVNYATESFEPITLRQAIRHSTSSALIQTVFRLDPSAVERTMGDLGFRSGRVDPLSLAIGSAPVTILELTNAYATFADGGTATAPRFTQGPGASSKQSVRVLTSDQAHRLTGMIRSSTSQEESTLISGMATKRGVTASGQDGWFIGYTQSLVVGVWIGATPGAPAAVSAELDRVAESIWAGFSASALEEL